MTTGGGGLGGGGEGDGGGGLGGGGERVGGDGGGGDGGGAPQPAVEAPRLARVRPQELAVQPASSFTRVKRLFAVTLAIFPP